MVILEVHVGLLWGAVGRRYQGYGIAEAITAVVLAVLVSQILIFAGTAFSYIAGVNTFFNFPEALNQQAAIGFFCGSTVATRDQPITECASGGGATRLRIPAEGTADDVTNPPRIAPRHLIDLGIGADNLFHTSGAKVRLRFSVVNLTNKEALYNFLSTFTGTHFVTPRAYQFQVGVTF
jgi:hypothetical protein